MFHVIELENFLLHYVPLSATLNNVALLLQ